MATFNGMMGQVLNEMSLARNATFLYHSYVIEDEQVVEFDAKPVESSPDIQVRIVQQFTIRKERFVITQEDSSKNG